MGNKRGGLIFGVIMGTLLGVLFAPRKGKELRKQLKDEVAHGGMGTETIKKNFKEMGQDMATTAEEVYNMPEVKKQVVKGKKHVDKFIRKAESKMNKAEQKVKDLGEKYLDLDGEKMEEISGKIHKASKNVQGKIQTFREKLMGQKIMKELGFKKRPISSASKSTPQNPKKSKIPREEKTARHHAKPRTKNVKIKKHRP